MVVAGVWSSGVMKQQRLPRVRCNLLPLSGLQVALLSLLRHRQVSGRRSAIAVAKTQLNLSERESSVSARPRQLLQGVLRARQVHAVHPVHQIRREDREQRHLPAAVIDHVRVVAHLVHGLLKVVGLFNARIVTSSAWVIWFYDDRQSKDFADMHYTRRCCMNQGFF